MRARSSCGAIPSSSAARPTPSPTGIGMVHQHFQLIPVFTVAENIILGDEMRKGPVLDLDGARTRIRELGDQYGLHIDPDAMVGDLSVGEQQRVELVKALFRDADILILDEPTAVLTPGEVDDFFTMVRNLVDQGKSIIFITHKLREVLAVADRITVLRGGRVVGTADPKEATQQSLATLMVGRDVVLHHRQGARQPGDVVLEARAYRPGRPRRHHRQRPRPRGARRGDLRHRRRRGQRPARARRGARRHARKVGRHRRDRSASDVTHATPRDVIELGRGPRAGGPQQARARRTVHASPTTSSSTASGGSPSPVVASATRGPSSGEAVELVEAVRRPHHRAPTSRWTTCPAGTSRR